MLFCCFLEIKKTVTKELLLFSFKVLEVFVVVNVVLLFYKFFVVVVAHVWLQRKTWFLQTKTLRKKLLSF